jgi:hypothetical protein
MSADKKGKMMTLTLDPYQAQMHGSGLFGDIGNFFSRTVPSTLIHQGLPIAGSVLGGMAGTALAPEIAPVSGFAGSQLGRMAGKRLADETGRRTGYGMKKGRGQPIEDQQFSLSDVARTVKRMSGGKVHKKGKGVLSDLAKMAAPHAKRMAKEVATKVARKAGSHLLHNVLPVATEQLGGMAGDYFEVKGGKDAGRMLGKMLEQEIASRTGLGMKLKRGRPKKGGALMVAGVR